MKSCLHDDIHELACFYRHLYFSLCNKTSKYRVTIYNTDKQ